MRAPIHAVKHYVQVSLATVAAGALLQVQFAKAQEQSTVNLADEVVEGSIIKAVYVEMWVRSGETSPGTAFLTIVKTPDNSNFVFADAIALHDYTNKKNVLYHTQGLTNFNQADAIPFVRGWFKIPKSKQRMGLGDRLVLGIAAQALDSVVCGFMTYKEYR